MPASIIAYAIFLRNILCILFKMFCAVVRSIFMGCPPVKTYFPFLFSELLLTLSREFDTLKSKKVLQSLEIGLFFCQIFIFII